MVVRAVVVDVGCADRVVVVVAGAEVLLVVLAAAVVLVVLAGEEVDESARGPGSFQLVGIAGQRGTR